MMKTNTRTLLLNWIYYPPVGHAVEGIAAAADYAAKNPDYEIHLLLNHHTPTELAELCPWIKKAYAIDIDDVALNGEKSHCLSELPREWDYIICSGRLVAN